VLPIITTPYISRVLGAENIGIYSYTYSIVSYFILFGSLGVALYGKREIAYVQQDVKERSKVFWEILLFRMITIFIATIAYVFFFMNFQLEYKVYYIILVLFFIVCARGITRM
jgi:O-antigen/teichoic acid export membrane protein